MLKKLVQKIFSARFLNVVTPLRHIYRGSETSDM